MNEPAYMEWNGNPMPLLVQENDRQLFIVLGCLYWRTYTLEVWTDFWYDIVPSLNEKQENSTKKL